ncbi:MAG: TAXI family TRAP transporter solute-binding subunit [Rickettsiales bacterium]|jgi:TRAP transporter TAXI family solute receptor|nr:TAXI family TRAP transporter solute-binding subunit [Rickettsiales bacterium]
MRFWLALFMALTWPFALFASDAIGIVTGPRTGTYYAFGKDIAEALAKDKIDVDIKDSEGSIDNIKRINSNENAALGIVQSDVLGFLSRSQNPESIKMASKLRIVFPFYNEEIHVLAKKPNLTIADLNGKKVAIGEEGSGNMLTAINLFAISGVEPAEMKKMSPAEGVVAVLKGELDAVVFVGGKPVRLFKNLEDLSRPENQKFASLMNDVHFLPLDSPKLLEEYRPATLTNNDYSFITTPVPTVAVQAVLMSFDLSTNKARCKQLGEFARSLREKLPELKDRGHIKWKEVNLEASSGLWKKDSCAWSETQARPAPVDEKKELLNILEKRS